MWDHSTMVFPNTRTKIVAQPEKWVESERASSPAPISSSFCSPRRHRGIVFSPYAAHSITFPIRYHLHLDSFGGDWQPSSSVQESKSGRVASRPIVSCQTTRLGTLNRGTHPFLLPICCHTASKGLNRCPTFVEELAVAFLLTSIFFPRFSCICGIYVKL